MCLGLDLEMSQGNVLVTEIETTNRKQILILLLCQSNKTRITLRELRLHSCNFPAFLLQYLYLLLLVFIQFTSGSLVDTRNWRNRKISSFLLLYHHCSLLSFLSAEVKLLFAFNNAFISVGIISFRVCGFACWLLNVNAIDLRVFASV